MFHLVLIWIVEDYMFFLIWSHPQSFDWAKHLNLLFFYPPLAKPFYLLGFQVFATHTTLKNEKLLGPLVYSTP